MRALVLGHAVPKLRRLETSAAFYRDVPGLREVARPGADVAFFSCGQDHHDLALLEVGAAAASPDARQAGFHHLAFKVGDTPDALRASCDQLAAQGVAIEGQADHRVSQALYCRDPDGILTECRVDAAAAVCREHPEAVAHVGALRL